MKPPKRKSLFVAFLLWFFLGIFAAHKLYLGRRREATLLLLAYFLLPLAAAVAALLAMQLLGIVLVPPDLKPEEVQALIRSRPFLAMTGLVLAVLCVIWIWDFRVLLRQVREHNARIDQGEGG